MCFYAIIYALQVSMMLFAICICIAIPIARDCLFLFVGSCTRDVLDSYCALRTYLYC
jgi:hypothetical protein